LNLTIAGSAFNPEVAVGIPVVVDPLTDLDSTEPAYVRLAYSTPEEATDSVRRQQLPLGTTETLNPELPVAHAHSTHLKGSMQDQKAANNPGEKGSLPPLPPFPTKQKIANC